MRCGKVLLLKPLLYLTFNMLSINNYCNCPIVKNAYQNVLRQKLLLICLFYVPHILICHIFNDCLLSYWIDSLIWKKGGWIKRIFTQSKQISEWCWWWMMTHILMMNDDTYGFDNFSKKEKVNIRMLMDETVCWETKSETKDMWSETKLHI